MINRERKYFNIRHARKPKLSPCMDHWSRFIGIDRSGYFRINYSVHFTNYIGMLFPHGIGEDRRVVLQVHELGYSTYVVSATYADNTHTEILWIAKSKPKWIQALIK